MPYGGIRRSLEPTQRRLFATPPIYPVVASFGGCIETKTEVPSAIWGSELESACSPGSVWGFPFTCTQGALSTLLSLPLEILLEHNMAVTAGLAIEAGAGAQHVTSLPFGNRARLSSSHLAQIEARRGLMARYQMPAAWQQMTLVSLVVGSMPIEVRPGVVSALGLIQIETSGTLTLGCQAGLPIESLRQLAKVAGTQIETGTQVFAFSLPIEWTGSIQLEAVQEMPIEAGGGVSMTARLPYEQLGANQLVVGASLPIEAVTAIGRVFGPAVEIVPAPGQEMVLVDQWNVVQKLDVSLPDVWNVVSVRMLVDFEDQWTVKQLLGGTFTDSWRVLPQKLLDLSSADIQLPKASAEKA